MRLGKYLIASKSVTTYKKRRSWSYFILRLIRSFTDM